MSNGRHLLGAKWGASAWPMCLPELFLGPNRWPWEEDVYILKVFIL